MIIPWYRICLIKNLLGLKGNAQDILTLVNTIIREYESQSKDSSERLRAALKKYADKNNMTELDVYNSLEAARNKLKMIRDKK